MDNSLGSSDINEHDLEDYGIRILPETPGFYDGFAHQVLNKQIFKSIGYQLADIFYFFSNTSSFRHLNQFSSQKKSDQGKLIYAVTADSLITLPRQPVIKLERKRERNRVVRAKILVSSKLG
jgi:hypothetical protein